MSDAVKELEILEAIESTLQAMPSAPHVQLSPVIRGQDSEEYDAVYIYPGDTETMLDTPAKYRMTFSVNVALVVSTRPDNLVQALYDLQRRVIKALLLKRPGHPFGLEFVSHMKLVSAFVPEDNEDGQALDMARAFDFEFTIESTAADLVD